MLYIKDIDKDKLQSLITSAYNNVVDDIDLRISELIQEYMDLGYMQKEASLKVLSKYREIAEKEKSNIFKSLGKYRTLYNDFFNDSTDSYLEGYSGKCAVFLTEELLKFNNCIISDEFDNEEQVEDFFKRKIFCFEILNRINTENNSTNEIEHKEADYIIAIELAEAFYDQYNNIIWVSMPKKAFLRCFERNSVRTMYPVFKSRMKNKFIRFLVASKFDAKGEEIEELILRCFNIKNFKGSKNDLKRYAKEADHIDRWIDNLFKEKEKKI